jgi:guanylate kinase
MKEDAMIISLSGPSGIGKGFIKEQLLQAYPFIKELAWFTTRSLRPNEKAGNRISVSISEFNKLVGNGNLVLVQDIFGHRYGLKKEDLVPRPQVSLTEFHPDNLRTAMKINPEIVAIGFVTSDLSFLRKRLSVLRNTESRVEIEQRITMAKFEIETILRNKSLFTAVIEVTEASESSVFDQVLTTLIPYLIGKEGKNHAH